MAENEQDKMSEVRASKDRIAAAQERQKEEALAFLLEHRRELALEAASRVASRAGYNGTTYNIVGMARVFEGYLKTGERPTRDEILAIVTRDEA